MILGEPTLKAILNLIETEGCPSCGADAGTIFVNGPSEIILEGCGHVIDAEPFLNTE